MKPPIKTENWLAPGLCALLMASVSSPAIAQLSLPDWHSAVNQNAYPQGKVVVISDDVSNGTATDATALKIKRTRKRRADGSVRVLKDTKRNKVIARKVPAGFDIGNSYFVIPDTSSHASYAATEIVSKNNKVKTNVEFILTQGETWIDGKNYRSTKTNGDLKAVIKFRSGQARNLRVLRYAQGAWEQVLKERFDASGCAGDAQKAIACVTSLSDGGPAATNATDTKPDQLVQIGFDLSQFPSVLNPNPIVGNAMTVRTSRDIALGNL